MSADAATTPAKPALQHFSLDDLAAYPAEQAFGPTAGPDFAARPDYEHAVAAAPSGRGAAAT
jgi:hypothetical protein